MDAKDWIKYYIEVYQRHIEYHTENIAEALEDADVKKQRFHQGAKFALESVISDLERFQARLQEV